MWLNHKYLIGSSLEGLEADSILYLKQMKALKLDSAAHITKGFRQVYLNLLGKENLDHPTHFSGESLSEEEYHRLRESELVGTVFFAQHGILLTYFGDYATYADMVIKVGHDHLQKVHVASPYNIWDTFMKGVSCFGAAHATRKKKYVKMGQIFRSKINKWIDMGNPNVKHYGLLLDAEWMALKGKKTDAVKQYQVAILLAARGGYQHDAALTTERFGEFCLKVMGDREDAAYQIMQSIKYWGEWGAVAKVHHLLEKYGGLLPTSSTTLPVSASGEYVSAM
jgi:hypothetical protein